MLGLPVGVCACLFDLDGVLTDTASVHKMAWKTMFDAYLSKHAQDTGERFTAFDTSTDYLRHIDGRPRVDGVRAMLASRNISLAEGKPDDEVDTETVHGLANRKNIIFRHALRTVGVKVFDGSREYLQTAAHLGLRRAVVSSSANTHEILEITGLDRWIEQCVDGVTLREENLPGKPAPDAFLRAAQLLGVTPAQAAVFEDSVFGIAAGRAGEFGFVVGVDRVGQAERLHRYGADIVVGDLAEML